MEVLQAHGLTVDPVDISLGAGGAVLPGVEKLARMQARAGEVGWEAAALAAVLNRANAPNHVLHPMGGFGHEDRPGGVIEAPRLRAIAAYRLTARGRAYSVERLPHHINAPETATVAVAALFDRMPHD